MKRIGWYNTITVPLKPHHLGTSELIQVLNFWPTFEVKIELLVEALGVVPPILLAQHLNFLCSHAVIILLDVINIGVRHRLVRVHDEALKPFPILGRLELV